MLLCTQLAPARHVVQVGERIITRRGCPLSRLNSVFSVEIELSEMTLPLRELVLAPPGGADEHDARTRPAAATAATPADRDLRRVRQATRIPVRLLQAATSSMASARPRREPETAVGRRGAPRS
jgi:hypothetical protein